MISRTKLIIYAETIAQQSYKRIPSHQHNPQTKLDTGLISMQICVTSLAIQIAFL